MEDLIVIIIMIAISVVGAVTRSKKKRGAAVSAKSPQPQSKSPDFWETLFEEDQPAEPVFAPENIVNEQEPVKAPVEETTPEPVLFEEGSPQRMDNIKEGEIKTGEIGSLENTSKILEGFSLKKAVVFSEIINQKYF